MEMTKEIVFEMLKEKGYKNIRTRKLSETTFEAVATKNIGKKVNCILEVSQAGINLVSTWV